MPLPKPLDLDGTVAAATGAASGLGIELSGAMTETGADVVCSDVREGACAGSEATELAPMKRTAEAKEIRGAESSSPLRPRRA